MRSELIVNTRPKSNISENIRTVRTNLEFASASKKLKTILISSSISGEGKSFVSSNLAVAFAQNDKKVLLIDADLRRGRMHDIFNVKNPKGLSNLLLEDDMEEIKHYIAKSDIDNLYVLFRGTIPPNPSELLNSDKMHDIFEIAEEIFDYIIIDGVPAIGLPDALILSKYADAIMLVCAIKYTPMNALVEAKQAFEKIGVPVTGVVVNKVPNIKSNYYTSYYE